MSRQVIYKCDRCGFLFDPPDNLPGEPNNQTLFDCGWGIAGRYVRDKDATMVFCPECIKVMPRSFLMVLDTKLTQLGGEIPPMDVFDGDVSIRPIDDPAERHADGLRVARILYVEVLQTPEVSAQMREAICRTCEKSEGTYTLGEGSTRGECEYCGRKLPIVRDTVGRVVARCGTCHTTNFKPLEPGSSTVLCWAGHEQPFIRGKAEKNAEEKS